ncbi:GNAT family N-acetyltransferase [Guggenheimella bovis]
METENLTIEETREEELRELMAIERHPENEPELFVSSYEEHLGHMKADDYFLFSIKEKGKSELVGYAMVQLFKESQVYLLRRLAFLTKNKGYGQEALKKLMEHCFKDLGYYRFYLDVYPHNKRAKHVYEKLGLIHEGTMRGNYVYNGKRLDQELYSILKPEYEQSGGC